MNELNLNAMGVTEMNNRQMKEVDGGILPLLVIAAGILLLSNCNNNVNIQVGGGQENNQNASDTTSTGGN